MNDQEYGQDGTVSRALFAFCSILGTVGAPLSISRTLREQKLHRLFDRAKPLFMQALIIILIEHELPQNVKAQTAQWRSLGLQNVPIVNLIVSEAKSTSEGFESVSRTIIAETPTDIYRWPGDGQWRILNGIPLDEEITCFNFSTIRGQDLICISRSGIMQSFPLGSGWQFIGGGFSPKRSIISLDVARSQPNIMYAVLKNVEPMPGDDDLVATTDGGENWVCIETLPRHTYYISLREVYIDPRSSNVIYVTMDGVGFPWVIKSTDAGSTWQDVRHSDCVDEVTNLLFDPLKSKTIYFIGGTLHRRGIYKSTDGLKAYHLKKYIQHLHTLAMHPANRRCLYAVAFPHSVYQSKDAGESWSTINTDSLGGAVVLSIAVDSQGSIYLGTAERGVFVCEMKKATIFSSQNRKRHTISISQASLRQK